MQLSTFQAPEINKGLLIELSSQPHAAAGRPSQPLALNYREDREAGEHACWPMAGAAANLRRALPNGAIFQSAVAALVAARRRLSVAVASVADSSYHGCVGTARNSGRALASAWRCRWSVGAWSELRLGGRTSDRRGYLISIPIGKLFSHHFPTLLPPHPTHLGSAVQALSATLRLGFPSEHELVLNRIQVT
ncbi:hypothetical protein BD626DRAFT_4195 [Schizophyllum amplum]|uniref:Uncharacterized protein n=1 Tax=Schizophyllum amplum TaxID=97359 RepID=A0A550CW51_9AGAR|nr:hypothetical protein BD626DRAFT_4195 [Auriculariopsis ampla]